MITRTMKSTRILLFSLFINVFILYSQPLGNNYISGTLEGIFTIYDDDLWSMDKALFREGEGNTDYIFDQYRAVRLL